jgi:hypothetical protein
MLCELSAHKTFRLYNHVDIALGGLVGKEMFLLCSMLSSCKRGAILRINLDEDDAPLVEDRDAAERIISEIILNDVITKGSFVIEGYSAARRIARALTAARADERRRGFETPFRMRKTKPAAGAPAVMAKWPSLRPLYHWARSKVSPSRVIEPAIGMR